MKMIEPVLLTCLLLPLAQKAESPVSEVRLKISVLDPINRYVTDLEKQHFRVYEGRLEQSINYFASKSAPLSLAIVFDTTKIMQADVAALHKSLPALLNAANPEDELALVWFGTKSVLVEKFRSGRDAVAIEQPIGQVVGLSRLEEALYLALANVRNKAATKRGVVLATGAGGMETYVAFDAFEQSDVQLYEIQRAPLPRDDSTRWVELTGGRTYTINQPSELEYYIGLIHSELRCQYILGYVHSGPRAPDIRRVSIKVHPPKGSPKMTLRMWKVK